MELVQTYNERRNGWQHIRKRIFRTHNIFEYKGPGDSLSLNDFYKAYGYTCFYQSDTEHVGEISPEELTITFVCNRYPKKMINHLTGHRGFVVSREGAGIYYLNGDEFPIQLLVTKELSKEENLWLRSLRTDIKSEEEINNLVRHYDRKKDSKLYQAAMDAITRANWVKMEEVKVMCEALRELFADELEEAVEEATGEIEERVGKTERTRMLTLITSMIEDGKTDQIPRLSKEPEFLNEMLGEYEIS